MRSGGRLTRRQFAGAFEMKKKPQLVIIDTDYDYLKNIEENVIRRFSRMAEVQFITDAGYVDAWFSEQQSIDLLVVDDENYGEQLTGQMIHHIFLMTDQLDSDRTYPEHVDVFLKNTDSQELLDRMENILENSRDTETAATPGEPGEEKISEDERRDTQIIGVYSPIGGCGKSMICQALARKLKMLDQQVLVIGSDPTQSLSAFFREERYASDDLAEKLKHPDEDTYWTILQNIVQEEVSYLLPFEKTPRAMGLKDEQLKVLLDILTDKKDFDYIILDLGTEMTCGRQEIMNRARAMILVTEPNEIASRKMSRLLRNTGALPTCECILLSNEYHSDGMKIPNNTVFGSILTHTNWVDAEEDPVFYNVALRLTDQQ